MGKKNRKLRDDESFDKIRDGLKSALDMAQGKATMGRVNVLAQNLHAAYDIALDRFTVKNRDARVTENEELRVTTSFKHLTISDDRYSGDTVSLEILDYQKDGWYSNLDLVTFLLVSSFDITETVARDICKRFYGPRVVS